MSADDRSVVPIDPTTKEWTFMVDTSKNTKANTRLGITVTADVMTVRFYDLQNLDNPMYWSIDMTYWDWADFLAPYLTKHCPSDNVTTNTP